MKSIGIVLMMILVSFAANAKEVCYLAQGPAFAPSRLCLSALIRDEKDALLKKPVIRVSGGNLAGTFVIYAQEYSGDQEMEVYASRIFSQSAEGSCGYSETVVIEINVVEDFKSPLSPEYVIIKARKSSTPDSCHVKAETQEVRYFKDN